MLFALKCSQISTKFDCVLIKLDSLILIPKHRASTVFLIISKMKKKC